MATETSIERRRALTRINAGDMLEALGLTHIQRGRWLLELLCQPGAGWFAGEAMAFDERVATEGLIAAASWLAARQVAAMVTAGLELIPRQGPLLIAANHPGLTDTIALAASLPRHDLRIVAADRPFLRALPQLGRHLVFLADEPRSGMTVMRAATRHLRRGGAILTFPGGAIEPDPALRPDAGTAFEAWSTSLDGLARLVPELTILPAVVSGVLSASAQRHPLTRLRRAPKDRERLGAMLQLLVPAYRDVTVRVAYGRPLAVGPMLAAGEAVSITRAVAAAARRLVEQPPTDWELLLQQHPSRPRPVALT